MSVFSAFFKIAEVTWSTNDAAKPCNIKIIDPGEAYQWCIANRVDPSPFWGKANRISANYVGWIPQPSYLLVTGQTAALLSRELSNGYKPSLSKIEVRLIYSPDLANYNLGGTFIQENISTYFNLYAVSCVNINPQHSGNDGIYLLELHDDTYFYSRQYEAYESGSAGTDPLPNTRQYNVIQPGTIDVPPTYYASSGDHFNVSDWSTPYADAWEILNTPFDASGGPSVPSLPAHSDVPQNIVRSSNGIQLATYIEQLLNVTRARIANGNTIVQFNDGLSDDTIEALDSFGDRLRYKAASTANDYYLDWPERFVICHPYRWAPLVSPKIVDTQREYIVRSSVTLPSDSGVDPAFCNNRVVKICSPVFAEMRPTTFSPSPTYTPDNSATLATLADTYRDRFISRISTAHQTLHYIIRGFAYHSVGSGYQVNSRIHEVFYRDYGDSDGFVTEFRGGRKVLQRLLGDPFSMLSRPLWTYPGIGDLRHPRDVSPICGLGQITNPTINSSATTAIVQGTTGAETATAMSFSTYYIGATYVGTKRVWVFPNPTSATATAYYSV